MNISLGDVQETALIPLAVRADETLRKNNRITDIKAARYHFTQCPNAEFAKAHGLLHVLPLL